MKRDALIRSICRRALRAGLAYCDTETTDDVYDAGIGPYHGITHMWRAGRSPKRCIGSRVFGVAVADDKFRACFVRVDEPLFSTVREVLASPRITTVWHNYGYDKIHCDVSDIRVRGPWEDTLLLARLWDDSRKHGLKSLYSELTGDPPEEEQDLKDDLRRQKSASTRAGNPKGYVNYSFGERSIMDRYACGDVVRTGHLYTLLDPAVTGETRDLYELDKRCVALAVSMTHAGVEFDVSACRAALKRAERVASRLDTELHEAARQAGVSDFAPTKSVKVVELLVAQGVPAFLLSKEGKPCTDKAALSGLAGNGAPSPTALKVLEFRKVAKLASSYLRPLVGYARFSSPPAIHSQWHVGGARTGRLTSSAPSGQVIPRANKDKPNALASMIRQMFVPRRGFVNLYIDYSQIELRYLAAACQDPAMIAAYKAGSDLHTLTSTRLNISRQDSKPVNFLIIYGGGPAALASNIGVSFSKAAHFIKAWLEAYPLVTKHQNTLRKELHYNGFIKDFFGTQYKYPAKAPNTAINTEVQGGCSRILKYAMANVHDYLQRKDRMRILQCIHDELAIEVPLEHYSLRLVREICDIMEDVPQFTEHGVDLIVEPSIARDNWAGKKEIEGWR